MSVRTYLSPFIENSFGINSFGVNDTRSLTARERVLTALRKI